MLALSVRTRLWLPVMAMCVMLVVMSSLSWVRTSRLAQEAQKEQQAQADKLMLTLQWTGLTATNASRFVATHLSDDVGVDTRLKPEMDATSAQVSELQKRLDELPHTAAEDALLKAIADKRQAYVAVRDAVRARRQGGDVAGARQEMEARLKPALAAYLAAQQAFVDEQHRIGTVLNETATAQRMRTVVMVAGVMALITLGLAGGTVYLVRSICRPLETVVKVAHAIADGDLTHPVPTGRRDEIGEVLDALQHMQTSLQRVVGAVRGAVDQIQVASHEVAAGNQDLSARTERTASHLQQTASSMEELTGTVRQTADSARTAQQLAGSAASAAQRGGQVVGEVVNSMTAIQESSRRIAE